MVDEFVFGRKYMDTFGFHKHNRYNYNLCYTFYLETCLMMSMKTILR